jgi:Putative addiction module component
MNSLRAIFSSHLTSLQLTPADRARLVDRLIATLDADPEIEKARAVEVERRQAEIESGTVTLLPGPKPSQVES